MRREPKPTHPCSICGSTDWWWQPDSRWGPGEWLCGRCHPNPNPAPKEVEVLTNTKAHRPCQLQDGTIVPSVTAALGILNKGEQLQNWIWECGRQGVDYREVRDAAGRVGTLSHYLITCHLKGEVPDTSEYSTPDIEKAKSCLTKYQRWESAHPLSPVMIEAPLVSEEFRYGGTLDLFAELAGEFILVDFKTGGAIYPEDFSQLAAYRKLLEEQGWPVANARILRIGADQDEGFEEKIKTSLDREFKIFQHALEIYRLQSEAR